MSAKVDERHRKLADIVQLWGDLPRGFWLHKKLERIGEVIAQRVADAMQQARLEANELSSCMAQIEALGPEVAWALGTITNERHILHPYGKGVTVTISGNGTTVFEKAADFSTATQRAIARYRERIAALKAEVSGSNDKSELRWPGDTFDYWPDVCPTGEHKNGYCCQACDHSYPVECACFEVMEMEKQIRRASYKAEVRR